MVRPKVALVLSSGFAKGFSHIGVLKVLEEHNIPIDLIVGTSMGALVGAYYSKYQSAHLIERFAKNQMKGKRLITLFDLGFKKKGLISGERIESMIKENLKNSHFSDLQIPLIINACDIHSGKSVAFRKGSVADAVRASIGIPLLFGVKKINGRSFVDGGIVEPLGLSFVDPKKYKLIIAVDVNTGNDKMSHDSPKVMDILMRSIELLHEQIIKSALSKHKNVIVIRPNMENIRLIDVRKVENIIHRGETAAKSKIKIILKKLKNSS